MSAGRHRALFTATPLRLQGGSSRIVIPRLPSTQGASTASHDSSPSTPGHTSRRASSEYHENKHIPRHTAEFLGRDGANALHRQEQLSRFHQATAAAVEGVWRDSKPHLRRQQALVEQFGVEGAVREVLNPSTTSFREQLRSRPLDRAILEEIYLGLHGKRIERRLKRGVSWEHWITKGDGTAPVYATSRKAQQTFAFGGNVRQVAVATHPQQFPTVLLPGRGAAPPRASPRHRALVDRAALVPEVAFIGRTSSGKSSLINAILNATVAPYGHLQGTTSGVHFFSVAGKVMLVDCPGYGYYHPMQTPALDAENAVRAMRAYLRAGAQRRSQPPRTGESTSAAADAPERGALPVGERAYARPIPSATTPAAASVRAEGGPVGDDDVDGVEGEGGLGNRGRAALVQPRNLKRVFVCVPARGMQHADVAYCRMLEQLGIPFSVVLTKTDGSPIRMLARLTDYTRSQLVQYNQCKELMLTSSLRLAGIDKMQSLIGSMAVTEDPMNGAVLDFSSIV